MLSEQDEVKYRRQILLSEVGEEGQRRLQQARVLIAGLGGLGSAASIYLACAGVGNIRLVDCDTVSPSDLNRQFLYSEEDIGTVKVHCAKRRLQLLNSKSCIEAANDRIDEDNVYGLVDGCDIVVDCLDNFPARLALNSAAINGRLPLLHGAVLGFEGRVTTILPGKTPCMRCLYADAISLDEMPVIGTTPGVIGCIQASEAIKYIVGSGDLLVSRMLVYDGLSSRFREVFVERDPGCSVCQGV